MKFPTSRILCTLTGLAAVLCAQPTIADDSEVFTSSAFTTGVGARPNVLFIMDTSGSMDGEVIVYDPPKTYTGSCDPGYVYWGTSNSDTPPDCTTTTRKFTLANNRCRASYVGMLTNGWWNGRSQQLNTASPTSWVDLAAGADRKVECQGDHGNHGDTIASSRPGGTKSLGAQWQRHQSLGHRHFQQPGQLDHQAASIPSTAPTTSTTTTAEAKGRALHAWISSRTWPRTWSRRCRA